MQKSKREYYLFDYESKVNVKKYGLPKAYYVYALINPLDGSIFYIGKGKLNRAWSHKTSKLFNQDKINVIETILDNKLNYIINVIKDDLSEEDAVLMEYVIISNLINRSDNNISLTNKATHKYQVTHSNYDKIKERERCNREIIEYLYCQIGLTTNQMLTYLNISRSVFYSYLNEYNLKKPKDKVINPLSRSRRVITDGVKVKHLYEGQTMPSGWRYGLQDNIVRKSTLLDQNEIIELYINQDLRFNDVVKLLDTTPDILRSNMNRLGIRKNKPTYKDLDLELLYFVRSESNASIKKIAEIMDSTYDIIASGLRYLKSQGINTH